MEPNTEENVKFADYQQHYNEDDFWKKIGRFAKKAGIKVVYLALKLFYATKSPATPAWARAAIYGALGYFILPVDLVPDLIPGGYCDDLGVLIAALATVSTHITPKEEMAARQKLGDWFGEVSDEELM